MKQETRFRQALLAFMALGAMLALAAYLWPNSWAARVFPGIAKVNAAELALPKVPAGFQISIYARGVRNARLMQLTPEGDLIVSTSRDEMVYLVHADRDGDGQADKVQGLIGGLNEPHGIWLEGNDLYVAEEHQVSLYRFDSKAKKATHVKAVLRGLPDTGGHSTRTLKKGPDGWLYVSAGSSCNVCIESHPWRSAILRFQPGVKAQLVGAGLRNSVGMAFRPGTDELYATNAGRDNMGDDMPREEMNLIKQGRHYGWPYVHGANNTPDPRYGKRAPAGLKFTKPVYTFTAHSTPLSINFLKNQKNPDLNGTALVALHGSWNRTERSGYKVVLLRWQADGTITQEDFVTGFLPGGRVIGRPVEAFEAPDGTIYLSDDYADVIYRIAPSGT